MSDDEADVARATGSQPGDEPEGDHDEDTAREVSDAGGNGAAIPESDAARDATIKAAIDRTKTALQGSAVPAADTSSPAPAPGGAAQGGAKAPQKAEQPSIPPPPRNAAIPDGSTAATPVVKAVDPGAYEALQQQSPKHAALVDEIASETGVSPGRIVAHWHLESGGKLQEETSETGARGIMQVGSEARDMVDPKHLLDPDSVQGSLTLGARYIHMLDGLYGKDSPMSIGAYVAGPARILQIAQHPEHADQAYPKTMKYIREALGDPNFKAEDLKNWIPKGGDPEKDLARLVNTAKSEGPQGVLNDITLTAAPGMGPSDAWRRAQTAGMQMFIARGDYAGAQHFSDWLLQVAHAGSNQFMMSAYTAMQRGDTQGAIQALAKAHAFFPDDTIGRFATDQNGRIWGQRVDEHDQSRAIGAPFEVTPQSIVHMLRQTADPAKFAAMVQAEQESVAKIRREDAQARMYEQRNPTLQAIAQGHDATRLSATAMNNETQLEAADIRSGARSGTPDKQLQARVDHEVTNHQDEFPQTAPGRIGMADVYRDLRTTSGGQITEPAAIAITKGLADGSLMAVPRGGQFQIERKDGAPVATLSPALSQRMAGGAIPQPAQQSSSPPGIGASSGTGPGVAVQTPSPVGAAASSPIAQAQGMRPGLDANTTDDERRKREAALRSPLVPRPGKTSPESAMALDALNRQQRQALP